MFQRRKKVKFSIMSAPIVITVPTKYVPINLAPAAGITIKMESPLDDDDDESTSSMEEFLSRGNRKRRLDHLTWEEKLQRKKLKNRVAAQTSRDRKKAKMEDMDKTIQEQADQINELQSKCDTLAQEKDAIYGKYLDLEGRFEELKRRLDEQQLQQQQQQISTATHIKSEPSPDLASGSVGCVSTLLGSAAGIIFNGSTNDAARVHAAGDDEDGRKGGSLVEDNCALPALQDMLEDFDVSKLEELAESLLADVTSELEEPDRGSSPPNAQDASTGGRMPGPVVGTSPERLEPGQETNQGSSLILTTHNYSKSPFHVEKPHLLLQAESGTEALLQQSVVNGTYDNESNCITIILHDDDDERLCSALEEEIICEESDEEMQLQEPEFQIKMEPMQQLLSPIPSIMSTSSYSSEPIKNEDPVDTVKNPLTPRSFVSDGGYESIGSPDYSIGSLEDFWNLDLFPILN